MVKYYKKMIYIKKVKKYHLKIKNKINNIIYNEYEETN